MTLWALRVAVLGRGPWILVDREENLATLQNPPRRRQPATAKAWNLSDSLF